MKYAILKLNTDSLNDTTPASKSPMSSRNYYLAGEGKPSTIFTEDLGAKCKNEAS